MTVSIHAPARGATSDNVVRFGGIDVSIHAPARGATHFLGMIAYFILVSIHAPARGATKALLMRYIVITVSIHAPARGATFIDVSQCAHLMFQSTHPHGVRPGHARQFIHHRCFNPRTRTGCDVNGSVYRGCRRFQSTHPHGVRHKDCIFPRQCPACFNPRTRTGCDILDIHCDLVKHGFNPRTRTGCDTSR